MSNWVDKNGIRHVGIMVRGQRVHRTLPAGATASDAKQLEADLRAAIGHKRAPTIPGDPPLSAVLELYAEHAETLRSPDTAKFHAARIAPWAAKYRASQAKACAAAFIKDATKKVDKPDGTKGPAYTAATINRSLGALTKGLTLAWDRELTPENYGLKVTRLPENNQREIFLTIDQVREVAQHCAPAAQAAIWTALLTGARRGEVCKIQAHHIHRDRIDIPASHTKSFKVRAVPIVPALRPWLKHFPLQLNYYGVQSAWRRARVKAGLEHVNFHDLRHSCASILIGLGVDLYTVGEILGHTSTQTTKRYAHLQMGRKADALGKLGELVVPTKATARAKRAA